VTATDLRPYPSPAEREAELDLLAEDLGATLEVYGRSFDGAPLRAIRIPALVDDAPRILCSANIHGPEYVAGRVAFGLLHALRREDPPALALRRRAEIWVVPCINPDGYRKTWEAEGRGTLAALRTNARGVDLNRNFPLPDGQRRRRLPGAGTAQPGRATYHGPEALSEPETRDLDALLQRGRFHASANLHSFMGTVIPARVTDRPSFARYRELCRALALGQPSHRYRRLHARVLDVFTGEQEDHQHHTHGTWSVCVETFTVLASYRQHVRAPSTFWRFNPRDPAPWVANDVPGLLAYFAAALDAPPATSSCRTGS
jgi:predicted deacylase